MSGVTIIIYAHRSTILERNKDITIFLQVFYYFTVLINISIKKYTCCLKISYVYIVDNITIFIFIIYIFYNRLCYILLNF